jgi:hypothetical protein
MPQYRHMIACFLCKRQFQFGAHVYEGGRIRAWDIMVCHRCRRANHDGIVPALHPYLVTHLKTRGIEPRKNAKGLICWPEWPDT